MSGAVSPQKGRGGAAHLSALKGAQIATDGPVWAILGPLAETLTGCAGGCGLLVLSQHHWGNLSKPQRKTLRESGIHRNSAYGRCWKCAENVPSGQTAKRFIGRQKISPENLEKLPSIWEEIRSQGGTLRDLGARLGTSGERARQLVKEHSLPQPHTAKARAQIFLEELEHLAGLGMGVQYIARALGMEPDALVKKVDWLHQTGKTKVQFTTYNRRYDKQQEAA